MTRDHVEPFVERLYAASLDAFTETRKALAAELKARGAKAEAAALLALKKPTRTAWALNQVARNEPRALASFLAATETLRKAQASAIAKGSAAPLREASRALNGAIAAIVALAKRALEGAGASLTTTQQRIVTRTLHAIPFASAEDVDRFSRGTLIVDLDAPAEFSFARDGHAIEGSDDAPPQTPRREIRGVAKSKATKARDLQAERRAAAEAARAAKREAQRAAAEAKARARGASRLDAIAQRAEEAATVAERDAEVASRHAADLASRAREARTKADIDRAAAAKASAQLHRSAR